MQIPIAGLRFETFSAAPQLATQQANDFLKAHDLLKEPLNDVAKNVSIVDGQLVLTIILQIVTPGPMPIATPQRPLSVPTPNNGRR